MGGSAYVVRKPPHSLCAIGIAFGALSFALSLTPTLVPRLYLTQAILAGLCFAIGYAGGVFLRWLWHYLELPDPPVRIRLLANTLAVVTSLLVLIVFLQRSATWQNSIRTVMGLPSVDSSHPVK